MILSPMELCRVAKPSGLNLQLAEPSRFFEGRRV